MRRRCTIAAVWGLALLWPALVSAQSDLERARSFYNGGQYDEAIAAAAKEKSRPAAAPSAVLITARARLERFRRTSDAADLNEARKELMSLNPRSLVAQEAIEWQIGLGTELVLEKQFGPAAEMFAAVLPVARARLSASEFEKLLEWWAGTVSHVAEELTGDARKEQYRALQSAVRSELSMDPVSRPAIYWTIVAARGAGDFEGAWNAAIAGWIRAGSQAEGTLLRADIERFVVQTLIPERAQARTGQRLETDVTIAEIATMTEEFRTLTERWRVTG